MANRFFWKYKNLKSIFATEVTSPYYALNTHPGTNAMWVEDTEFLDTETTKKCIELP